MKHRLNLSVALGLILTFCLTTAAQTPKVWKSIKIDGGSASTVFIKQAVVGYAKAKQVGISVDQNGTAAGFQCLKTKECQIAMGTAEAPEADKDQVVRTHLGWDGLAVVTSSDVTVPGLSTEQIRGIFEGKIKNWKEVGGADAPIKAFQREKVRGSRDFFDNLFKVKSDGVGLAELGANDQVINIMRREKNAIAYLGFGSAYSSGQGIKLLKIDGAEPTKENIANGKYPLRRALLLFRHKDVVGDPMIDGLVEAILKARAEFFPKIGFIE